MLRNYTYEEIYNVIATKGYTLKFNQSLVDDLPKWPSRSKVSLTPEQAQKLIKISGYLNKTQKIRLDKSLRLKFYFSELADDEKNINLLSNYKVTNRSYLAKLISESCAPHDVYVNMKNPNGFGFGNENEYICSELLKAVGTILEDHGHTLPKLDDKIWNKELPKRLYGILNVELFDDIRHADSKDEIYNNPIIIGIMSSNRMEEYPDKICILNSSNQTGEVEYYPCTLIPKNEDDDRLLTIKPGLYEDLFFPDNHSEIGYVNLIQSRPVSLYIPVIVDNKLSDFKLSAYNYMRVGIPVQKPNNGSLLVGAKFDCTNTEDLFITNLGIDYISDAITYVVLQDVDFEKD